MKKLRSYKTLSVEVLIREQKYGLIRLGSLKIKQVLACFRVFIGCRAKKSDILGLEFNPLVQKYQLITILKHCLHWGSKY